MKRAIGLLFVFATLAAAQKFEVASVRVSGPDSPHGSEGGPGNRDATRFSCGSCSMDLLIQKAFSVEPFQISSAVPIDKDSWDVVANVPAGATKEEFRAMLAHLMQERLGLHFHMESRMFPGYELVVAKSGFLLRDGEAGRATGDADPDFHFGANVSTWAGRYSMSGGYLLTHVVVQLEPMSVIALALAERDTPVVDHTGLTGKYSFTLDFTRERIGAEGTPSAPSVFTAVQKELGLQLVAKKLPFDVLVVDSFNKTPSEN